MADRIRLTLPDQPAFADVAAETAATIALRFGFAGAEVDRLRREVADAFVRAAGGSGKHDEARTSVLVEFVVDVNAIAVHIADDRIPLIHLRRRRPT